MLRLVVNPDSTGAWEIELRPGLNTLGRDQENDFPIEHDSVSSAHCQIEVQGGAVRVRDLGSTNGTFVGERLIDEETLLPGEDLRLGNVRLRLEDDGLRARKATVPVQAEEGIPRAPRVALPGGSSPGGFCKLHPRATARYTCPACHEGYCELCVNTRADRGAARKFCRKCGAECAPLAVFAKPATGGSRNTGWVRAASDTLAYPIKGDGMVLLIAGTVFLSVLQGAVFLCQFALVYGAVAMLFLTVFGVGYLANYLQKIVTSTAMGQDAVPDWPDFTDFSSAAGSPFLQFLATIVVSFSPALLARHFSSSAQPWSEAAFIAAACFGCVYFPMAFLAVAMFDSLAALNPMLILPSMAKMPLAYLFTLVLLALVVSVNAACERLLDGFVPFHVLNVILSAGVNLYLMVVGMRILGLLYRAQQKKLSWIGQC